MDDATAVSRQRMVDALRTLAAGAGRGNAEKVELVRWGRGFDVNRYFSVLTHLSMEPGFVLDYAYHTNVVPHIYARKIDEPRCLSLSQVRDRTDERSNAEHVLTYMHGAYDYHHHIQVDDTEDGFFQLILLVVMGGQFYLFWHALYNDTAIVCTQAGLEALLAEWNDRRYPIPSHVLEQARGFDLAPTVEMGGDQVQVRVAQFTKWGGLLRRTYQLQRAFPHKSLDCRGKALVRYDCGIVF